MSTFNGRISEIPEISVDNFEKGNESSLIYFLSHCHTDHMKGLYNVDFQNALVQRPDVYIYASPMSVKILKNMYKDKSCYPPIEEKLKEIPIYNSTLIKVPHSDKYFTVTLIPAGHCPGSVMFLFETNDKTVLYTGDYRAFADDLKKCKAFYSFDKIKKINKMYLDTTFFNASYQKLPPRNVSVEKICSAIREWLEKSSNHLINIIPTAKYGSEYLFMEISKEIEMPIHVDEDCYNVYKCIPEMDNVITLDGNNTQIHSNCAPGWKNVCFKNTELVRVIKPTTLWWKNKNMDNGCVEMDGDNCFRICYSSHASFEEIKDFLLFLKPEEVHPCVVPSYAYEENKLMKLLEQVMKLYKAEDIGNDEVKLFHCIEEDTFQHKKIEEDDFLDDLLHSPINNF